jgi:hypothetical protein
LFGGQAKDGLYEHKDAQLRVKAGLDGRDGLAILGS